MLRQSRFSKIMLLLAQVINLKDNPLILGKGGSEQIREGAQISEKPPTDHVERFLSMLRLDSRGKVNALAVLSTQK
jgi:hypothetical protein